MSCLKTTLSILCCFFVGLIEGKAQIYSLDSVYYVKINPLLDKIITLDNLEANIQLSKDTYIIPTNGTQFALNVQEVIKDKNVLYVTIQQTGFLFQYMGRKDSLAIFRRMDETININYNIGCLTFIYQGQIYSYGGYGFWKSNGHVRKYNFIDKQWDIIPTNNEIFNLDYNWFSKKAGKLYVPFQKKINAGLIGGTSYTNGTENYQSYAFDIQTTKWEKIGAFSRKLIELINSTKSGAGQYTLENGQVLVINDEVWFLNYEENKVYHSTKADFNQFFVRRSGFFDSFLYKGVLYSYNVGTKEFSTIPFDLSNFELMNYPIWGRDTSYDLYIAGSVVFVLLMIGSILFFNNRYKQKLEHAQLRLLKTKSANQAFVGAEVSLVELLLAAAKENKKVDIFQINRVLGIKDKNIGLQKKVRSDMINAINEKYQFITQREIVLISSVRKEDDKRFFEYFIAATEINTIQRILQKN